MNNRPCHIFRVARQCGVTLGDAEDNRTSGRRPRQCFCKPTLREIGRKHGEAHLALVLRLIVETGNGLELHASTIHAVSDVVLADQIDVGGTLFDAFDKIDLGRLRTWARATGSRAPISATMTAALLVALSGPAVWQREAA